MMEKHFCIASFNGVYITIGIKSEEEVKEFSKSFIPKILALDNLRIVYESMMILSKYLRATKLADRRWCFRDQGREIRKVLPRLNLASEEMVIETFLTGTMLLSVIQLDQVPQDESNGLQLLEIFDPIEDFLSRNYDSAKHCRALSCSKRAQKLCPCFQVRYCSKRCQLLDWKWHKDRCYHKLTA